MNPEQDRVRKWRRGQQAAERRARELVALEGPRPERAVGEALSALNLLEATGSWPGDRDAVAVESLEIVRRRWRRVQKRAKRIQAR